MKNLLLLFVIFAFISVSGCGNKNESESIKKDETKSEDVKTETKDEKVKSDDKSVTNNDLGVTEGVPKNFPGDIPQPKNSKCLGSLSSSDGTIVNFESTDKVKDIVENFKDEMKKNGFDIMEGGEIIVSDDYAMLGWKKKEREITIVIAHNKDEAKSEIALTYK